MQFGFHSVTHIQLINEFRDTLFRDGGICAGQGFKCLIGMGIAFAAEDGLDGFCTHCPVVFEILVQCFFAQQEFAESFERGGEGDECMSHRDTDVADDGRVGQVALQAADGQLRAQMLQNGIGDAEVASEFSKSMGLTLCGMALEPTSPALICCLKYSIDTYCQKSRSKSIRIV